MGEQVFFSGKTIEQAISSAATHHGLGPEEVAYHEVQKKRGVAKARRGVVIRVDPESPRSVGEVGATSAPEMVAEESPLMEATVAVAESEEPEDAKDDFDHGAEAELEPEREESEPEASEPEPEPEPERESEEEPVSTNRDEKNDSEDDDEEPLSEADAVLVAAAGKWLNRLLALSQLELDSEIWPGTDGLEIELFGEDESLVVEEEGQILRSLQHLLPRLLHSDAGRLVHCRVDCDNYQEDREQELQDLAERVAREVLSKGRPKTLRPMHPADRRVVHLALADDPDVTTESVGDGYFKRVMVKEGS